MFCQSSSLSIFNFLLYTSSPPPCDLHCTRQLDIIKPLEHFQCQLGSLASQLYLLLCFWSLYNLAQLGAAVCCLQCSEWGMQIPACCVALVASMSLNKKSKTKKLAGYKKPKNQTTEQKQKAQQQRATYKKWKTKKLTGYKKGKTKQHNKNKRLNSKGQLTKNQFFHERRSNAIKDLSLPYTFNQ